MYEYFIIHVYMRTYTQGVYEQDIERQMMNVNVARGNMYEYFIIHIYVRTYTQGVYEPDIERQMMNVNAGNYALAVE